MPRLDPESYKTAVLMFLKKLLIETGTVDTASAWAAAKALRAYIDEKQAP